MRALIHESPGAEGAGALDVAGRSLIVRQLQFLRDAGIEDVVVEVCEGVHAVELARYLLGDDPLVARTLVIPSARPIGIEELARRAGCDPHEAFLALPAQLALHAKLTL